MMAIALVCTCYHDATVFKDQTKGMWKQCVTQMWKASAYGQWTPDMRPLVSKEEQCSGESTWNESTYQMKATANELWQSVRLEVTRRQSRSNDKLPRMSHWQWNRKKKACFKKWETDVELDLVRKWQQSKREMEMNELATSDRSMFAKSRQLKQVFCGNKTKTFSKSQTP